MSDFLEEAIQEEEKAVFDDSVLSQIRELVEEMNVLDERITKGEALLKELKDRYQEITEKLIPDLTIAQGIDKLKVKGIGEIQVTTVFRASVPKSREGEFKAWANENGYGGILKEKMELENPTADFLESAAAAGFNFDVKLNIPWQTMSKLAREVTEQGKELPECVNAFSTFKTKIKK